MAYYGDGDGDSSCGSIARALAKKERKKEKRVKEIACIVSPGSIAAASPLARLRAAVEHIPILLQPTRHNHGHGRGGGGGSGGSILHEHIEHANIDPLE